jgi:small-conductance mechanosensitive channel
MTVEELIADALHGTDEYLPSPDLFAKVQRSIAEDAAHRRRIRRITSWSAVGVLTAAAWVAGFLEIRDGVATMPWWTVEVLTAAILITITVLFGPLIRRFGIVLTDAVFGSNEPTSRRFLAVLDIAYYLIFSAYLLMSTSFAPQVEWGGRLAAQVEHDLARIGGLLLVMGILHAITIAVLPLVGLIFASNWRRAVRAELGADAPEPDPQAEKADRVARIIVWIVAALLAWQAIGLLVGPGIFGLILGAD